MNDRYPLLGAERFSASGPGPRGPVDETPTPARVYDYLLGGKDNYRSDREFGDRLKVARPDIVEAVKANRAFLGRAVTWLAQRGIAQFIDIGTGLPTKANVHEIARRVNPAARVVYVDNDPVVVAHGEALLSAAGDTTAMVRGDLRDPMMIFVDPDLRRLIDLDRPVAVLMVAVLHFVPDEHDPYGVTDQLTRFFKGFDLVPPGVVPVNRWHSARTKARTRSAGGDVWVHGGIGRRP